MTAPSASIVADRRHRFIQRVTSHGIGIESAYDVLGLRFPFGPTFRQEAYLAQPKTKAEWDAEPYNPPSWLPSETSPDPNADAKPTWDEMLRAFWLVTINESMAHGIETANFEITTLSSRIADEPVDHEHADHSVHIRDGLDQLTAMLHHSSRAQTAGTRWPLTIMHDVEGNLLPLWTTDEAEGVLGPHARNKIRTASALSIIGAKMYGALATAQSEHGGLDETADEDTKLVAREIAAEEFVAIWSRVRAAARRGEALPDLEAAFKDLDRMAEEGPEDLDRAKNRLIGDLEAVAMGRVKFLRGAVSQQRIDMQAACNDMETDEKTIALEEMVAQLEIMAAETVEEAKKEFDLGVLKINAVKAGRVPEFFNAADGEKFIVPVVTLNVATLTVLAKQPPMPQGRVAMVAQALPVINDDGTPRPFSATATVSKVPDKTDSKAVLVVQAGTAGRFKLRAGNICGFTEIEIILVPPAA